MGNRGQGRKRKRGKNQDWKGSEVLKRDVGWPDQRCTCTAKVLHRVKGVKGCRTRSEEAEEKRKQNMKKKWCGRKDKIIRRKHGKKERDKSEEEKKRR